jgi:WD40 repeat protein
MPGNPNLALAGRRLWDVTAGKRLKEFEGREDFAFTPNGKCMVGRPANSSEMSLLDAQTGAVIRSFGKPKPMPPGKNVFFAISPDSRLLAFLADPNTLKVVELASGATVLEAQDPVNEATALDFGPDGKLLACGAKEGYVHLVEVATGHAVRTTPGEGPVSAVAISPDGRLLAWGGKKLCVLSLEPGKTAGGPRQVPFPGNLSAIAFTPDSRQLAYSCAHSSGPIRLLDAATLDLVQELRGQRSWASTIAFSADGSQLLCLTWDGSLGIWQRGEAQKAGQP